MKKVRIIKLSDSQVIELPREFRFQCETVEIFKRGNEVILREKPANLGRAFELLASLPDDFFASN